MKKYLLLLLLATAATPGYAQVFGALANFDVVNDTGKTAHGFEIELHDIHAADITSIFGDASRWPNMERYGAPTVTEFTDNISLGYGVKITYQAKNNGASWNVGTPSGTLPVNPSDSCWPLGAPTYGPKYPCDHFGVSTSVNTPSVKYSWLVEDVNPNNLVPVQASVPNPQWVVTPVPPVANVPQPPVVHVVIAAPAPNQYEFGEARWVKVSATGVMNNVAVEDLVAENAVIKKDQAAVPPQNGTQTQTEWQLLQVDANSPNSGQIDLSGVQLDPGAKSIVYRFEFYQFAGAYNAETHEVVLNGCGDTSPPVGACAGLLGQFLVAQNAGFNFDGVIPAAPPLPIAPTLNATINGATLGSPYTQVITATPANVGDNLTYAITGLPQGLSLTGNTISGTPTVVGSFPLTVTVNDTSNNTSTSGSTQIDVADSAIVFSPNPLTLSQGTVNVPYSQKLSSTGGYGAIKYSITPALPAGLTLTADTISGTPTVAGSTDLTVQATDSLNYSQVATATLTIASPVQQAPVSCSAVNKVVSSVSAPSLMIGGGLGNGGQTVNYGNAKLTFVAPATVVAANELVSYDGTLDNTGNCLATTMTVAPGLSLKPIVLGAGTVGTAYPATAVTPTGGIGPYTVTVSPLPSGMSFDGKAIGGTPKLGANGVTTISISANDAIGETVNLTLSLTVNAPPVIIPTVNLPATGTVGVFYSGNVGASGGVGALTISATGLPAGLALSGGVISGTPGITGSNAVAVTVKDSIGQSLTVNKTVTINNSVKINKHLANNFAGPSGDFSVAAATSALTVARKASVSDKITVAALSGFKNAVSLEISGLPNHVKASFSPSFISGGAGTSMLTITASNPAKVGSYVVTIKGVSGTVSHSQIVTLTVQ
jgi:hypothetical protein